MAGKKIKKKKNILLICFCLITIGLLVGGWIESFFVKANHVWINDPEMHQALKGKTVIHISDLHIKKIGKREKQVLKIIEELEPDLIFLTGDYVTWRGDYEPALVFLSKLEAKIGVWAVMGDYDYSDSRKSCLFCHKPGSGEFTQRHKVRFLKNTIEVVRLDGEEVYLGSIDQEADLVFALDERLKQSGKSSPAIVLSHNPLAFDLLKNDQNVLLLAGDTHGGQIPLPSWLWNILGYEKNARFNQGFYQEGQKKMYVSRGIGTSHLPIRLFSRPEIAVLHFSINTAIK